jgi:hypothetical protein
MRSEVERNRSEVKVSYDLPEADPPPGSSRKDADLQAGKVTACDVKVKMLATYRKSRRRDKLVICEIQAGPESVDLLFSFLLFLNPIGVHFKQVDIRS